MQFVHFCGISHFPDSCGYLISPPRCELLKDSPFLIPGKYLGNVLSGGLAKASHGWVDFMGQTLCL